ncbi:hypothetical protein BH18THE2_BH18THE2_14840 [soil metagenome]
MKLRNDGSLSMYRANNISRMTSEIQACRGKYPNKSYSKMTITTKAVAIW